MDTELIARVLVSLVAFVQGTGPLLVDLNRTHATNPEWTPHARFHVVWQVLTQTGVSLTVLTLLWVFPSRLHTWIGVLLTFNWCFMFFATLSNVARFEGTLKDETTGIPPFVFRLGSRRLEIDTNLFAVLVAASTLSVAVLILLLS
ncbi:MAG: DUF6640 family protein [Acidobacteriota bacterium]